MKACQFFMGIAVAGALAFAGPALAHEMHGDMHHHMMGGDCCEKNLPPEKAKMAEGAMHQMMEKNKPLFERMHKLHEKMKAIGIADTFDKKAFLATAEEMSALQAKMEKNRTGMMAAVAEKLTAKERRDMVTCMERNFHRGEFGHGDWHHDGAPKGGQSSHNSGDSYNQ
jgi:Spy/CpxP family protein refolding chaperone